MAFLLLQTPSSGLISNNYSIHFKIIVMSVSRKYGRTYHYPFSPGTTSDDRINRDYWQHISKHEKIVHTEKLDGVIISVSLTHPFR